MHGFHMALVAAAGHSISSTRRCVLLQYKRSRFVGSQSAHAAAPSSPLHPILFLFPFPVHYPLVDHSLLSVELGVIS